MRKTVSLRLFSVAFASIFSIAGCQDIYKYNARPNLEKLLPAEIYDVQIDSTKNPIHAGEYYMINKGFVQARAYFEKALEHEPKNRTALLGLASSYSMLGQFTQADTYFKIFAETYGQTTAYKNDFGFSNILRGNLDRAEILLLQAYSQAPNSVTIKNNLDAIQKLRANKQAVTK